MLQGRVFAGIDVSKERLDCQLGEERLSVANDTAGLKLLIVRER